MTGGEFDDDRDEACDGTCSGHDDDDSMFGPWWPGGRHVELLMALTDQLVDDDDLDVIVPLDPAGRWPEPRLLWQTEVLFSPTRAPIPIQVLDAGQAAALLDGLEGCARSWHAVAVRDEQMTTSSGVLAAMASLGVPLIADVDPLVWLRSTVLHRHLTALIDDGTESRTT